MRLKLQSNFDLFEKGACEFPGRGVMNKIKVVENYVVEKFEKNGMKWFVELHLKVVRDFAAKLAEIKNADRGVVELSVWLHDITHAQNNIPNMHNKVNAEFSKTFLKEKGFDEETIEKVCHCILTHRCKDGYFPETLEARIVATADALSHIEKFDLLLELAFYAKKYSTKEAYEWLSKKIARDWNDKILVPEAKEMIKHKYEEVKILLEHMRNNL